MELRHLRYFVAVAEELNFSRAALRLHIAQPPLSAQIRHLEEELGVVLFERASRPLRLTEPGRFFYAEAIELLAKLDDTLRRTRKINRGCAGLLKIGFVGAAMNFILPSVLLRFRTDYPDVEVLLFEMLSREQAAALIEGRIHVGFVVPGLGEGELAEERLYDEPLVVAVPDSHRLANRASVTVADLAAEPVVLYGGRSAKGAGDHELLSLLRDAGIEPKVALEAQHAESALGLVAAGLGITLTVASFANTARAGIRFLPVTGRHLSQTMKLAYRHEERSSALKAFLKMVREEMLRSKANVETLLAS